MNITPVAHAVGAIVSVSRSRTVNLGNYESETVNITVAVPVAAGQDYDSVYNEALTFVTERLDAQVDEIVGRSANKQTKKRPARKEVVEEAEVADPSKEELLNEEVVDDVEEAGEEIPLIADVKAALKEVKNEHGNDAYKGILKEFGYTAVNKIEEENHAAIIAACNEYEPEVADDEDDLDDDLDGDSAEESTVTKDDVTAALKEYNAEHGKGSHLKVLAKFNAKKISDLDESDYAKVIAETV